MKKHSPANNHITFRVSDSMVAKINSAAAAVNMKKSQFIREVLDEWFDGYNDGQAMAQCILSNIGQGALPEGHVDETWEDVIVRKAHEILT